MIHIDCDQSEVSDGHHTFAELYDHRHALMLALMRALCTKAWISKQHDDGTMFEGWFIAGIDLKQGEPITYHMPENLWPFAVETGAQQLEKAPKWDGHTSKDVIFRLNAFVTRD